MITDQHNLARCTCSDTVRCKEQKLSQKRCDFLKCILYDEGKQNEKTVYTSRMDIPVKKINRTHIYDCVEGENRAIHDLIQKQSSTSKVQSVTLTVRNH